MVPRAKSRVVSKPGKGRGDQHGDSVNTTTKNASTAEHAATKIVGRPRGRPAAAHKMTKPAHKTKRPGDEAAETSNRDTIPAHESEGRRGKPLDEIQNSIPVDKRRQRGARQFKQGSGDEEDDIPDPNPQEKPAMQMETPVSQNLDPMIVDREPGQGVASATTPDEGHVDLKSEVAADDADAASLRRRVHELSKRYEDLQARHHELREVGVKAAELNFQRLRKQTDENRQVSERIISELRGELAKQSKVLDQAESLRQQLELSQAEVQEMRATLQTAKNALSESKSEVKAMSAKLAASRGNEINAKTSHSSSKAVGPAGNRALQETLQVAQAKEDMYGDLTGLIVRDLKRGQQEDVFDCIQTGRNGSIHFKLAVEKAAGSDYDDVQFTYRPQLDANRDSEVIEMLPDYLTEEITFPRGHASKFYTRLTKALTERVE